MSNFSVIIVILFLSIWLGVTISNFTGLNGKINKTWKDMMPFFKARYQLFPLIVNMARNQAKYDTNHLQDLLNIYTQFGDPRLTNDTIASLDQQATPLLSVLLKHFQSYPELARNPEFINLERNVLNIENQLNLYKSNYNQLVNEYNQSILGGSGKFIAIILRFVPKEFLTLTTLN